MALVLREVRGREACAKGGSPDEVRRRSLTKAAYALSASWPQAARCVRPAVPNVYSGTIARRPPQHPDGRVCQRGSASARVVRSAYRSVSQLSSYCSAEPMIPPTGAIGLPVRAGSTRPRTRGLRTQARGNLRGCRNHPSIDLKPLASKVLYCNTL